tara:strand:+ start:1210 stop:1521 length:312 start_codon:yes stop_codon:yes gene_type:complete
MIKFVEVKQLRDYNVMERKASARFELDEVWINPTSILQIRPDLMMKNNLSKGYLPMKLDDRQEFSRIKFGTGNNVSSVTVVGNPEVIAEKIFNTDGDRQLLRG